MCTAPNIMMRKIYEILDCKIQISADFEWKERDNLKPFVSEGDAECCFEFRRGISSTLNELVYMGEEKWVTEFGNSRTKHLVRQYAWYSEQDAIACQRSERFWEIEVSEEHFEKLIKSDILNFIPLERVINDIFGLMLHAAVVDWNGRGILFTGPSGIGKSTQASLWERHENACILNGDRSGIRKREGRFYAYGLPYAGTSNIYVNQAVPIEAIVVLQQAKDNQIIKLKQIDAFTKIYSESTVIPWDKNFIEKHSKIIQELVSHVPVYLLQCRPDLEAVAVLKEKLN